MEMDLSSASRHIRPKAICATLVLLCACESIPKPDVELEILAAGIIESEGEVMRADPSSSVGAQRTGARSMRVVESTALVPLRPGISYGIAFRVTRAPEESVQLRAVLKTSAPCKLKTTGEVVYHNDSVLSVRVGAVRHLAATIPATTEQNHCEGDPLPGIDTFTLLHDDKKLAEARFQIFRADPTK
jgi:hypothetical protein